MLSPEVIIAPRDRFKICPQDIICTYIYSMLTFISITLRKTFAEKSIYRGYPPMLQRRNTVQKIILR